MSEPTFNIGFFGALTLILITLKLLGKITISWWLVFMPLWAPVVLVLLVILIIYLLILVGVFSWERIKEKIRKWRD